MSNPFIIGPIAPENNPPINPQYFKPKEFVISNITLGITTSVTTTLDNDYVVGQLVRLLIPPTYGSFQLNGKEGFVISIPGSNMVVIDLDSSENVNAFIPSPSYGPTPPQIIAVGDVNTGTINPTPAQLGTYIPGAFINISPI